MCIAIQEVSIILVKAMVGLLGYDLYKRFRSYANTIALGVPKAPCTEEVLVN